jgi:putative selenium metabolism protein SsnA
MSLLVKNVTILTFDEENRVIEGGALYIEDGLIKEVGKTSDLERKYRDSPSIDGMEKVLIPGLINAHTHLYSSLARGMPISDSPKKFTEILEYIWWKLDKVLYEEDIFLSAIVGSIDAVRRGVTTLFDHHSSPNYIRNSLDIIESAIRKVGLRASLSYEVTDRNGEDKKREGIEENIRFAKKERRDSLITSSFGLHASFTLSDETLKEVKEAEEEINTGFHIHLAEGIEDLEHSLEYYGMRVAERLYSAGILGEKTIAAHGVHLDEREMDILKETRTPLIHNPSSNMNNAVGRAPIYKMLQRGVIVGLGTDGFTQDVFTEFRNAFLLMKHGEGDPSIGYEVFKIPFKNNPKIGEIHFGNKIGKIEEGSYADLVILDYIPPTPLNHETLFSHILFGIYSAPVLIVIVNGKVILEDGNFRNIDEKELKEKARDASLRVWERLRWV